jgi:hypothetical protein
MRPLTDAAAFISRRLSLREGDPRAHIYAAELMAATAGAAILLLDRFATGEITRDELLEAIDLGLDTLREPFPTGSRGSDGGF